MRLSIRLGPAVALLAVLVLAPSARSDEAQSAYDEAMRRAEPAVCKKDPAAVIKLIRALHLDAANKEPLPPLYTKERIERHKKLAERLPRLDVPKYCECRHQGMKKRLSPRAYRDATFFQILQEIAEKCIEESS